MKIHKVEPNLLGIEALLLYDMHTPYPYFFYFAYHVVIILRRGTVDNKLLLDSLVVLL